MIRNKRRLVLPAIGQVRLKGLPDGVEVGLATSHKPGDDYRIGAELSGKRNKKSAKCASSLSHNPLRFRIALISELYKSPHFDLVPDEIGRVKLCTARMAFECGEHCRARGNSIKATVLDLVGESMYPADFINTVKNYTYTDTNFTVKLALAEPVTDEKFIFYIGRDDLDDAIAEVRSGIIPDRASFMMIPVVSSP